MLVKILPASHGRVKIECDNPVFCDVINLDVAAKRKYVARSLGIPESWFIGKTPGEYIYEPEIVKDELCVRIRDMYSPDIIHTIIGEPYECISSALHFSTPCKNPVVEWDDSSLACFLDIDYHHITPPSANRIRFIMTRIQPQPALWFFSRHGGVHALYVKQNQLTANVLSAVASFSYRTIDPTASIDIIPRSRLPNTEVFVCTPTADINAVRRFLMAGVDESEIQFWLEQRGLQRSHKYTHEHCPVDPTTDTKGEPVWIGEHGIRCHRCEAKGITYGSRYPGFFPYSVVIGSHSLDEVALMVRNFTHFTHAEIVLNSKCRLRGKHARFAYEGMLRLVHGDDPRIEKVFYVGQSLIRGGGKWVTPERYETITDCRSTLATLPAVCREDGKPIPEKLDLFCNTVDLTKYGYPPVKPLRGMRIFGEFLGETTTVSTVLPPSKIPPLFCPRYVPPETRLNIDDAFARVEEVFPGLPRNYLLLLIAARGVAESEMGMPANILCVGPSSTGKSSVALLAASMIGDGCSEVVWTANIERFRQSYMAACDQGMFVVINEIFKNARQAKVAPSIAMDTFLNITPGSMSHVMYVGPASIGRLPVTIVTDTSVPPDVRNDAQLGRRFIFVRLDARRDWEDTFVRYGIGPDCNYRASSPDAAEACNAIVSYVIDRWFYDRPRSLKEIAEELGFATLEHSDEVDDDPDLIPRLFEEVCRAPEYNDARRRGRGWKRVVFGDETSLALAYQAVCDGIYSYDLFCSSRKCMETDLSLILPVPIGTRFQISRGSNRTVLIRFVYGETRGKGVYYVNEELLTCPGERRI